MKIKEVIKLAVYSRFNDFTATKIYHENGINFFTAIFYFKTISNSLIKGCFEIVISDVDYTITCKGFKVFLDNNEISLSARNQAIFSKLMIENHQLSDSKILSYSSEIFE